MEERKRGKYEHHIFGSLAFPDFTGWENPELIMMCDELYYSRCYDELDALGLYWVDAVSAVYDFGDYTGTDPIAEFQEIRERAYDEIIVMDEDEIRAAYKKEIEEAEV